MHKTPPKAINEEIVVDPKKTIMSKTNKKGIIEYANEYFMEICGYDEFELIGQPHNIIRHPDMPKIIFKLMWEKLLKKENIHALIKNLTKDGKFYWVITTFEAKTDENGNIIALYAKRKAAPRAAIIIIEELYKKLISIEKVKGLEVSRKYFEGFLEEKNMDYDTFITSIVIQENSKENSKKNKKLVYDLIFKEYGTFHNFKKDLHTLINRKISF